MRRTRSGSFASGPADAPVRLTRSTSPLLQTMVPIQAPTQALPQAPVPAAAAAAHQSPAPHPNELAIFWDYENVSLGVKFSETLLEGLLNHVRQYGRLIEARLYSDSAKLTMSGVSRAMLDRRGVTFIDCPTGNKKEAVDKKIIVDALVWALPRASTQRPCTVVLISGDGDFAHMLKDAVERRLHGGPRYARESCACLCVRRHCNRFAWSTDCREWARQGAPRWHQRTRSQRPIEAWQEASAGRLGREQWYHC